MKNAYWVATEHTSYDYHKRIVYRLYRNMLRNPFRYIKMDNYNLEKIPLVSKVADFAIEIIKDDSYEHIIIFPSSTPRTMKINTENFVVISKDYIKVIRKQFYRKFYDNLSSRTEKIIYIENLLEGAL